MMNKNLLFLSVLNLLSFSAFSDGFHNHEGENSRVTLLTQKPADLSAQLLPAASGQFGAGSVRISTHAHHHQNPTTSLKASVSLPLGVTGFNTDALSSVEALTVNLTNPDGSLNCALPLEDIDFTPVAGGTGYTAVARFELQGVRQAGQAPVYLVGSCTALPDSFSASSSLSASVFSGKTLLSTLSGSLN